MTISIEVRTRFDVVGVNDDTLTQQCDAIMATLVDMEADGVAIRDAAVSLDLSGGKVDIELIALGATFQEAEAHADSAIRSAITSAGGQPADQSASHAELVSA